MAKQSKDIAKAESYLTALIDANGCADLLRVCLRARAGEQWQQQPAILHQNLRALLRDIWAVHGPDGGEQAWPRIFCGHCQATIVLGRDGGRATRVYCNDRCRQAAWRAKRTK